MKNQPDSVKCIADYGFQIGWHSMNHDVMRRKSQEDFNKDIYNWKETLDNVVPDYIPSFARFPYGSGTKEQIELLKKQDLIIFPCAGKGVNTYNWDIDTMDWHPKEYYSLNQIIDEFSKFRNFPVIVLFHQVLAKPYQDKKNPNSPIVTESLI